MTPGAAAVLALLATGRAAGGEVEAEPAPRGEIELRHGEDALSGEVPGWRETVLRAAWSPRGRPGGSFQASRVERFGRVDSALGVSAQAPLSRRWLVGVEGGASATHHVLPAWSGGARAQCLLGGGAVALGTLRFSRFEAGAAGTGVAVGSLGLELYRGPFRVAWTTFGSTVEGARGASHAAAVDVYYRARDRAGLVLSAGRELESLGGGRVLVTGVRGAALAGRTALGRAWALTWGAEVQRQGDLYTRVGGRLGLARDL